MTNYLLNCISCKSTAATSSKNCIIDRDNIIRVIKHILNLCNWINYTTYNNVLISRLIYVHLLFLDLVYQNINFEERLNFFRDDIKTVPAHISLSIWYEEPSTEHKYSSQHKEETTQELSDIKCTSKKIMHGQYVHLRTTWLQTFSSYIAQHILDVFT